MVVKIMSRLLKTRTPDIRFVRAFCIILASDTQIAKLFTLCCYCYCCRRDNYAAAQLNHTTISSFGIDRTLINGAFAN